MTNFVTPMETWWGSNRSWWFFSFAWLIMIGFGYSFIYKFDHYGDVTMGAIASQITSLTSVYSAVTSDADQRKHQSSASLAFVRRIHRGPVNSPHKWPVLRKMFPFDDVLFVPMTRYEWFLFIHCLPRYTILLSLLPCVSIWNASTFF